MGVAEKNFNSLNIKFVLLLQINDTLVKAPRIMQGTGIENPVVSENFI
jgi:hypothetical protein